MPLVAGPLVFQIRLMRDFLVLTYIFQWSGSKWCFVRNIPTAFEEGGDFLMKRLHIENLMCSFWNYLKCEQNGKNFWISFASTLEPRQEIIS